MAELKEYIVPIDGVEHTMLLTQEDAVKRGLIDPEAAQAADVDAAVEARVDEIRTELRTEHDARVAQLEQEHTARMTALEQQFEERVAAEVTAALAEHQAAGADDTKPRGRQRSPKAAGADTGAE